MIDRDPFAGISTLTNVPGADEIGLELNQPFDETPIFDDKENPEINIGTMVKSSPAHRRLPSRRLFRDYRAKPEAYKHLRRFPRPGESLHLVIGAKYATFDLVPALIERRGIIQDLYLLTLGFSKNNAADLLGLLDGGQVRRVSLVCSCYFQRASSHIYSLLVPELIARGQRVAAIRNHTKILLARMKNGERYVVESSANLRSCDYIEQSVITNCPKLYQFHRRWIDKDVFKYARHGKPTKQTKAAG